MFGIWCGNCGVILSFVSDPVRLTSGAWLLAYDIASERRWRRMYRLARAEGIYLQHSLFLLPGDMLPKGFAEAVEEIIHAQEDDVRAYHLPVGTQVWYRQNCADGLVVSDLPW